MATSPEGILSHDALRALQSALRAHDIAVEPTGILDGQTQAAIRILQHRHGLAETGFPTLETLRLLGLDPSAIYKSPSPAANRPDEKAEP